MKKSFLNIIKLDNKYVNEEELIIIYDSVNKLKKIINLVFSLDKEIENKVSSMASIINI